MTHHWQRGRPGLSPRCRIHTAPGKNPHPQRPASNTASHAHGGNSGWHRPRRHTHAGRAGGTGTGGDAHATRLGPGNTKGTWRMRCLRFYTVWLANDEAAQACAILCWLQAGGFFYPSPYICDKGELIPTVPTQQLPEGTRLAILILTNSHWMGAEAEQKWDEWDPRFVGTTAEQCLRLTAELEPHLPTSQNWRNHDCTMGGYPPPLRLAGPAPVVQHERPTPTRRPLLPSHPGRCHAVRHPPAAKRAQTPP